MQAHEMRRMGADIEITADTARIVGRETLQGAPVMASDLRASASLVIAGLVADGETRVDRFIILTVAMKISRGTCNAWGGYPSYIDLRVTETQE